MDSSVNIIITGTGNLQNSCASLYCRWLYCVGLEPNPPLSEVYLRCSPKLSLVCFPPALAAHSTRLLMSIPSDKRNLKSAKNIGGETWQQWIKLPLGAELTARCCLHLGSMLKCSLVVSVLFLQRALSIYPRPSGFRVSLRTFHRLRVALKSLRSRPEILKGIKYVAFLLLVTLTLRPVDNWLEALHTSS